MTVVPSSVSRRLAACFEAYERNDYEAALVHFFPALDKVAKRRRPKDGVGARIRAFLKDEEALISAIATGNVFIGAVFDGVTFEDVIYKFGRTSIAHEGELDPRLQFVEGVGWSIGKVWKLPSKYIPALCVAVMAAPECNGERMAADARVTIFGREWELNQLWGAERAVKAHIAAVFRRPDLFTWTG
jgi:hypothetical protein